MGDLTLNFSRWEFKCPHCGRLVGPTIALVTMLQRARTGQCKPLHIVDSYRCPAYNKSIGGVIGSQHLLGNAADVSPFFATADQWERYGALGIGFNDSGVTHVDMTPGWHGLRFRDQH